MTIKRFLLLACVLAWFGKDGTAQSSTCSINGSFSSATNGSTKDNRLNSTGACINWRLTYQSTGFSALSISIQGAPDSSGTAGTFADITGATIVVQGSNPSTLLQGEVAIAQFFPWMRVKVNSTTGNGTITYNLNGVNATVVLNRPGSGGGSGSGGVTSFNARTGAVLPSSGDYTCADVTNCITTAYQTAEDEGTPVTQRNTINFVGAGVSVADTGGKTTVTIAGSSGGSAVTYGAIASLPAAGTAGNVYIPSDSYYWGLFDTGAAWTYRCMDGQTCTPPVAGNFTAVNSPTVATQTNGGIRISSAAGAGVNLRSYMMSAPMTPYTRVFRLKPLNSSQNNSELGVSFSDGTKYIFCRMQYNNQPNFLITRYTNATTVDSNSAVFDLAPWLFLSADYLTVRLGDTGTNITVEISTDGINFLNLFTEGRTAYLSSPSTLGVTVDSNNASFGTSAVLVAVN